MDKLITTLVNLGWRTNGLLTLALLAVVFTPLRDSGFISAGLPVVAGMTSATFFISATNEMLAWYEGLDAKQTLILDRSVYTRLEYTPLDSFPGLYGRRSKATLRNGRGVEIVLARRVYKNLVPSVQEWEDPLYYRIDLDELEVQDSKRVQRGKLNLSEHERLEIMSEEVPIWKRLLWRFVNWVIKL